MVRATGHGTRREQQLPDRGAGLLHAAYRLTDLGRHPNPAKAAEGKRLHGLAPDPQTAPVVQRIFDMYLAGYGIFAIAEALTRDDIPCPSAQDRTRNPEGCKLSARR
jgi:hypothetical protein